jgi:nucleoid-associated protein YgaU
MSNEKPDFSNVQSGATTTPAPQPDSGNPQNSAPAGSTAPISAATEAKAQTYTVVPGDSLSKIAKKFYGNANDWHAIFEANRDKISNPDLIRIGQVLTIPAASATRK